MTRVIRSYNKTAALLLQYELLHLQSWHQAAESTPHCLSAALLVRHDDSKVLVMSQLCEAQRAPHCGVGPDQVCVLQGVSVNLDRVVLEVLEEARWMSKLGVSVPKVIVTLSGRGARLKALHER